MDVRQLLLLANDNSTLAKKKAARLDCDSDDDELGISNQAVAVFLAKKKKFQAKIKAQEEESRRKRVNARLNASLKTTRIEKEKELIVEADNGRFLPGDMRYEKAKLAKEKELKRQQKEKEELQKEKELKEKRRQKQEEKRHAEEEEKELRRVEEEKAAKHRKRKSMSPEVSVPLKKKKSKDKEKYKAKYKEKGKEDHRKEKEDYRKEKEKEDRKERKYKSKEVFESSITYMSIAEKEKQAKEKMKEKDKKNKNNGASGMSFTDLMKLAKTNVATTRLTEKGTLVKKKEKSKTFDDEYGYTTTKEKEKTKIIWDEKNTHKSKWRDEYDDDEPPSKSKAVNGKTVNSKVVNGIDYNGKDERKEKHNGLSEKHVLNHNYEKESSKVNINKCKESSKSDKNRDYNNKIDKTKTDKIQDSSTSSSSSSRMIHSSNKHKDNEHRKQSKHKHDEINDKTSKIKDSAKENKYTRDSPPPVRRGLIAQTISTKKSGNIEPPSKITNTFKQVKPGKLSGIEAQCLRGGLGKEESVKMKMKKKVVRNNDSLEDELDREMRMLAKKRKLFERRGIKGNVEVEEDNIDNMYDSEEEYDLSEEESDYDDNFIDDTETAPDVSKAIRSITGYDRRVFDDSDEDIENMESNYSQIQKEEARSARIAMEEDRIEALKEAEELACQNAKRKEKEKEMLKKKTR